MKYVELATLYNQGKTIEAKALECAEVLKADIQAMITTEKAAITRNKSQLKTYERKLEEARSILTDDTDLYLSNIVTLRNKKEEMEAIIAKSEKVVRELTEDISVFK